MIKSVFLDYNYIDINKIEKLCSKYKYVSFDVFDTLIKRNLSSPKSIYDLLDNKAKKYNIDNFKHIRQISEIEIRNKQSFATIDEIYEVIGEKIGKDKSKHLLQEEIDLEMSYCTANEEIVQLFSYLKRSGKRIIAISDMYLTSKIINDILMKNNIYVDKVYVSCECKDKKRTGKLFKKVLNSENIAGSEIIHIGDSYKADYLGAFISGIKSIHIKHNKILFNNKKFYNKLTDKKKFDTFNSIINNNISTINNDYEKFGFTYLGPLLYNYCIWLNDKCEKNNLKKIYFFARDGYILKKIFDKLYPDKYETHYVYLSRRAIRIPFSSLNLEYDEFIKYFPRTKLFTVNVLLENFGLNSDKYNKVLEKLNLKKDDLLYYDDLLQNKKYETLFHLLEDDILSEATKEMNILKDYLKQENFFDKIAVVDIGWHNSIQYYLEKIFEHEHIDVEMFGFYLGLQSGERKVKNSFAFISDDVNGKYVDSVKSFIGLMESLFLANEGSTIKFQRKDKFIVPVQLEYEYLNDDDEIKCLSKIREGTLKFINIVQRLDDFEIFALNGYDAYLSLKSFGTNPYLQDISMFSKFRYYSEDISYFSNSKGLLMYIRNLKLLKKDFLTSRWKIAFMKETFKINLPYFLIYKVYKKMKGWY